MRRNRERGLSLLVMALLGLMLAGFTGGCSADKDSPEACRYDAISALDQGKYDKALSLLAKSGCRKAFSEAELQLNLAAAYIGRAGFDMLDLAREIVNTETGADQTADARLIEAFASKATGIGMGDLNRASAAYQKMLVIPGGIIATITEACAEPNIGGLSAYQKDACFINGLVAVAKAASTVSLLFGGDEGLDDLMAWLDNDDVLECEVDRNQNGAVDQGEITACALKVAMDPGADCGVATAGTQGTDLEFQPTGGDPVVLSPVRVVLDIDTGTCDGISGPGVDEIAGTFSRYRLLTEISPGIFTVVLTDGFCATAMEACDGPDYTNMPGNPCWPCPVIDDGGEALTMTDTLIKALNEDVDSLVNMLPVDQRGDLQSDLDEFRAEICGAVVPCDEITEEMIIDYLLQ